MPAWSAGRSGSLYGRVMIGRRHELKFSICIYIYTDVHLSDIDLNEEQHTRVELSW